MAWTPKLDECENGRRRHVLQRGVRLHVPRRRGQGRIIFEKNLDFARNVAVSTLDRDRPDRPRNATDDETQYQVKAAPDIEPNRFSVSYGASQTLEATARRILGTGRLRRPGGSPTRRQRARTLTLRAEDLRRGGERFGDLRGKCSPASPHADPGRLRAAGHGAVAAAAGRRRRGQRPRDRRLPATALLLPRGLHAAGGQCQASAGGCGRGLHGPVAEQDAVRDRRRATSTSTSRRSRPTATRSRRTRSLEQLASRSGSTPGSGSCWTSACCRTSTPSSTTRATTWCRQLLGQGVTDANYRRGGPVAANQTYNLTGSQHLTTSDVRNAQMLRNYMNEGGDYVFSGRNGSVQPDMHGDRPAELLRLHLVAGAGVRLQLSAEPGGRRRSPAHGVLPASSTSPTTGASGGSE